MSNLPRELAGADPRYCEFTLRFRSDLDKALYILAQTKPSKRDADYLAYAKAQLPGHTEAQLRALGCSIKARIKQLAKTSVGTITI